MNKSQFPEETLADRLEWATWNVPNGRTRSGLINSSRCYWGASAEEVRATLDELVRTKKIEIRETNFGERYFRVG